MRWFLALLLLPLFATAAAAHGGAFGHGPPVQRGIPCDCGLIECDKCADQPLRSGADVRVSSPNVTLSKRWGDIARCRVELSLATLPDRGTFEAYACVEPAPLFALVAGDLRNGEEALSGELRQSEEARRAYLYARRLFNKDPMLALRRGPGRIDVRVYPLRKGVTCKVVLEGYVLADRPSSLYARLYRTDDRYLAVVPLATDAHRGEAAFVDERGGRALHFLSEAQYRERFGSQYAEDVPFVPALESAVTGRGTRAANDSIALVAIATNSPQPPFIGPDRGGVPPGLREPQDPEPPPPPSPEPADPVPPPTASADAEPPPPAPAGPAASP